MGPADDLLEVYVERRHLAVCLQRKLEGGHGEWLSRIEAPPLINERCEPDVLFFFGAWTAVL